MAIQAYSLSKEGYKQLSPHFRVREFRCRDGSDPVFVDEELVSILQKIREPPPAWPTSPGTGGMWAGRML